MGYDISFHPISEEKMQEWYFDVLKNKSLITPLANTYKIDTGNDNNFYENKYLEIIEIGIQVTTEKDFDSSHAYYLANVQGFFDEFFYVRGASFSFIEEPIMDKYYTKWQDIIPSEYKNYTIYNEIQSNYYAGKFISYANVCKLLDDYHSNSEIKNILDNQFSHKRITVLLKALNYAKEHKLGLLEVDGVMEPNPTNLNNSTCYSNLFNCDIEGPLLFQEAVAEQLKEAEMMQEKRKSNTKPKKKGLFGRLFGKK